MSAILTIVRPVPTNGASGAPTEADSVASITTALAELRAESAIAQEAIDVALARRASLLLSVGTDDAISEIDAQVDAAQLALERLDCAEPILLGRLRATQDEERRAVLDDLVAMYRRAVSLYAAAARTTLRHRELIVKVRATAEAAGFGQQIDILMPAPYPSVLTSISAITTFELDNTR
jgi:hypothetical protein